MGIRQVTISLKKKSEMLKKGWFADWFDTEYYHMLYRKRDDKEAVDFIRSLIGFLDIPKNTCVADIACGKGRHSRVLAGLGYKVFGYDLSENSIQYARKHASGSEVFEVQDMRLPYPHSDFQAAFNLFTSFGYFDDKEDDMDALSHIYQMLNPGGYFIQDYINANPVLNGLPFQSEENCSGMKFSIHKFWKSPFVIKNIVVSAPDGNKEFMEKVKLFENDELQNMHRQVGFEVAHVFGDYQLKPYLAESSPRLIIVSNKPL
jgi:SAM-dependent methyltransferase